MKKSIIADLEEKPVKVNKWHLHDVKIAFDDLLVKYMVEELGFTQNHFYTNCKLMALLVLNVIGGSGAFCAYKYKPFEASKLIVGLCAASYLVLLGAWMMVSERMMWQTVFRGKLDEKTKVWLMTEMANPGGIYAVDIIDPIRAAGLKCCGRREGAVVARVEFKVGHWIDEDGYLVPQQSDLNLIKSKFNYIKSKVN